MNYIKIKMFGYIAFGICITLLVLMTLLGIWEIIGSDIAYKAATSLAIIAFAFLFFIAIGQKLFGEKE